MASSTRRVLIDDQFDDVATDVEGECPTHIKKDSRYSWLVCACSCTTQVFILGVLHAFGVFFVEFIRAFNSTQSKAAWVGSLAYGLSMTFGPLSSVLVNRFGCRIVMVTGCIICSISVLATSFVRNLSDMYASFSLFYGLGTCLCISPIMTIAPDYFDKYITVAVGIITAGSSIGTLVMAPLSQVLIDTIGWRNTFRFFSGTCVFSAVCCSFVKPVARKKSPIQKLRQSPARLLMQELKLWKNRVFVIWTMAITCVMFGFYIPYVHLVSYAVTVGVSPEKGSIIVMILGGCTAFGRVFFGKVVQSGILNRLHMHQLSMVVTGTGVMLLPLIKSFEGIIVYVLCVGLVDGCYVVLLPVLTASLVGADNAVLAWGFLVGTSSITFTLGPPVAGALYDAFGSYNVAFHCAGIPIIGGALLLLLIPWAQRTSQSNNIMITISDSRITEDYDFADDLLESSEMAKSNMSTMTLNADQSNGTVDPSDVKLIPKTPTKTYKDQSTLTSPGSGIGTSDIHHALSLLHENARLLASILNQKKDELQAERENKLRTSTKSRSEMIQTSNEYRDPTGAISIMSVPGGFTVSHVDSPQRIHSSVTNKSVSSVSQIGGLYPTSQTPLSTGSSLQSRQFIDPLGISPNPFVDPLGVSPNPFLSNTLQITSPKCLSPREFSPAAQSSSSATAPSTDQTSTITSQSGLHQDASLQDRKDPLNYFDQTILKGVELMRDTILATSPRNKIQNEEPISSSLDQETVSNTQSESKESGSSGQSKMSPYFTSPRLTSPRLTSIPEVVDAPVKDAEGAIPGIVDHWLENSPNDPHIFHPDTNEGMEPEMVGTIHSSSNVSHRSSASSESSHHQLDVFKHLFDDNEPID